MREKLNALTSLRFVLAMLVVLYHSMPTAVFADRPVLANTAEPGFNWED